MAAAFDPIRNDFPTFGSGGGVKRKPAVDPGIPVDPGSRGKTTPRLNPTLQTPAAAQPAPQVTRPGGAPVAPRVPSAPTAPSLPSGPPVTGAPSTQSPGAGVGIPPNLAAAMATPGGSVTQFGGAPTPARPTPQQAPQINTPAAGQQTTPSAPPVVQMPQRPALSPLAAATPAQTPGAAQVFRRGQGGLLGASGGLLEGGLGVPGTRGPQQAIPSELLALLAQMGQGGR